MRRLCASGIAVLTAGLPFVLAAQQSQQTGPTCEQVFKNIQSFKGVPARDLVPAMEFMSASLGFRCADCHDPKDFAAETKAKGTTRTMITLQRDINARYFNSQLEVTCMSCHNGKGHPDGTPIPANATIRHTRLQSPPKAEELFQKHLRAVGVEPVAMVFTGTQVAPAEQKGKEDTSPIELIQASGGRFRYDSGQGKFGSDGNQVWKDGMVLTDEPAAIFARLGRCWRGVHAFDGLERTNVVGKETLGKTETLIVRGSRPSTYSTEELYFDTRSGLLVRMVSWTRSTLGTVISAYDYSDYKPIKGVKAPMKVVATFAGGETWSMAFTSARAIEKVDDAVFRAGGK